MSLDFTGERYVPEQGWASIAYEHLSRYLFARRLAAGRRVLDLGSGEGYGSFTIAERADSVLGIDVDKAAIWHARGKYGKQRANLAYRQGSATALPCEDGRFDLVVCFEMLEHTAEQAQMLNEIRRVLAPGGLLLISTPNRLAYSDLPGYKNEFHVRELYLDEFRDLLATRFAHVQVLGQRNVSANVIADLDDAALRPLAVERIHRKNEHNEFEPVPAEPADHLYYVAVCGADAPLDLPGMLVVDRDDRLAREPGEQGHSRLLAQEREHGEIVASVRREMAMAGESYRLDLKTSARRHSTVVESFVQAIDLAGELSREVELRSQEAGESIEPEQNVYDLILPNFNSREVVRVCLDSLVANTDHRHRIFIIDDASTDPEVGPMLRGYAERWPHVHYHRLGTNLGFPGAVNTGIAMTRNDIVLINSDTEYPPGWLARLDRCRRSDPRIGIVSPLSNNATVCSVPQMNRKNLLPEGMTVAGMARLVAGSSLRRYPLVPAAVGYCMLVTRKVIDDVGVLDMAFGRGYGEEVDWCQRAWAKGHACALCDDGFVYHHGEVGHSEFAEMRALQIENEKLVGRRWPHYHEAVRIFCLLNPLRLQHQRLLEALRERRAPAKPRVLQVVHSFDELAGTELFTRRVVEANADRILSTVLHPRDLEPWFDAVAETEPTGFLKVRMNQKLLPIEHAIKGAPASLRSRMIERFFAEVVVGGGAQVVHFQHLQNYGTFQLPQIARALGRKVVASLHDYFLLCPDWNMIGPDGVCCGRSCASGDLGCTDCLSRRLRTLYGNRPLRLSEFLEERHALVGAALLACDVLVAPSQFVKQRFRAAYGDEIAGRIRVIPHGTTPYPFTPSWKPSKNLRVAFLGNMTEAKGGGVFLEVVRRMRGRPVAFEVQGGVSPEAAVEALPNLELKGKYDRAELPRLLQEVDVVVIASVWHETYCYTVDEAFRAGVPVIAARAGAIEERVEHERTGLLFDMGSADSLQQAIGRLETDRELLLAMRARVSKLALKTEQENMAEYAELYERLVSSRPDKDEIVARRMAANRRTVAPPQIELAEYCEERGFSNPLRDVGAVPSFQTELVSS
ncbi:MAG: methyltransferase domain-containing protein [Deltaproteobacteria bacterium]|nr:methyltransferase domain-containing protein [Deltaproteobacteria bacterium]